MRVGYPLWGTFSVLLALPGRRVAERGAALAMAI
jgi:hypothetical protein